MVKLPAFSIITPSYNCAAFIRQCIQSVLDQGYSNFEHIIVDGESQDGTVDILREYPHLQWVSEPDRGEGEALNKALRFVHGDIIGWLNADDRYLAGAFARVARGIDPQNNRHLVYGKTTVVNGNDDVVYHATPIRNVTIPSLARWFIALDLYPISMFLSRELVEEVGPYREDLHFSIDYEYWFRICTMGYQFHYIDQTFAVSRLLRPGCKSEAPSAVMERNWLHVSLPYVNQLPLGERLRFWKDYIIYYRLRRTVIHILPLQWRRRVRRALTTAQEYMAHRVPLNSSTRTIREQRENLR